MNPAPPVTTSLTSVSSRWTGRHRRAFARPAGPCGSPLAGLSLPERHEPVDGLGHPVPPAGQARDGPLAGERREGRPGSRPARFGGADRLDRYLEAGERHHLARELAPAAVATAGEVVEAGAHAQAQ